MEPLDISVADGGIVRVRVRQKVTDLQGQPLADQDHGLIDKVLFHVFQVHQGRIDWVDIEDAEQTPEESERGSDADRARQASRP